ncbi:MAG: hypothetical protein KGJ55_07720 [Gammaproteobacteria bacterium]|nr:hypothetical protein [Gammaproteobacteria bacterium]
MAANPEPKDSIRSLHTERPEVQPNPDRPEAADLLEVPGRMARVGLEKLKASVRKPPDMDWK